MHWRAALGVTMLMQITISFLSSAVAVIGPLMTEAAGVPIERIGYFSALSTLGSMWYLMSCGPLLPRFGPVRLLQVGVGLAAISILLVTLADWTLVLFAAFLFGLGYGPVPPASSDILARHTPGARRGLAFSIKQAGVPVGHAIGGLSIPILAVVFDWRVALVVAGALAVVAVFSITPLREGFDAGRTRNQRVAILRFFAPSNLLQPYRLVRATPGLPWITYAGFCFACAQGCLFSFYVAYLTADLGLAVTITGFAYAALQAAGACGRILAGWVADRVTGITTLTALGITSMGALLLTAALPVGIALPLLLATAAITGLAGVSWNGVYLAEVARLSPEGRVGEATSASTFFSFIGYAVGPALFSFLVETTGGYRLVFVLYALLPATAMLALLRLRFRVR